MNTMGRVWIRFISPYFLLVQASACADHVVTTNSPQRLQLSNVRVSERGVDQEGAFCEELTLDSVQARHFFEAALVLDADQWHHDYDYLPCYVRGTATDGTTEVSWEIRAGGTATVKAPGRPIVLLGCAKCAEGFR